MAILPADRFVALAPASAGKQGVLQTKPLKMSGGQLLVNAQLAKADDLAVELLDEQGNVIPGYSRVQSRLTVHDKLRYSVQWKNKDQLASIKDIAGKQPVALRFLLRGGDLYAFQVVD